MTCHLYADAAKKQIVEDYVVDNAILSEHDLRVEHKNPMVSVCNPQKEQLLLNAKEGDCIVFADATSLPYSSVQVMQLMQLAVDKKVDIHIAKLGLHINNQAGVINTLEFLKLMRNLSCDVAI